MEIPQRLLVVGTSAGGMPVLEQLVAALPADLPAAVLIVQHFAAVSDGGHLVRRLARATGLVCHLAADGDLLQPGHLYLAPPDRHLLVTDDRLRVTKGPHENGYRPAVDALFRSAAVHFGPAVVGVVLTGMLHDGTAGLEYIKRCGGLAVVQDPADAEFPGMPESARRHVALDYIAPLAELGPLLRRLLEAPAPLSTAPIPDDLLREAAIAERIVGTVAEVAVLGQQVPLTCPDCGGNLWRMDTAHGRVPRYRCHTGHAHTADYLLDRSQHNLEESLWVALRLLEERRTLLTGLAGTGDGTFSAQQQERITQLTVHANRLREFLLHGTGGHD